MAAKKSAKSESQEVVPAAAENTAAVTDPPEQETPVEATAEMLEEQEAPVGATAEILEEQEIPVEATAEMLEEQEAPVGATAEILEEQETPVEATAEMLEEQEAPVGATAKEPEEQGDHVEEMDALEATDPPGQEGSPGKAEEKIFMITCRNPVSEKIGGVMFLGGVGYTRDSYAASWFANKEGYTVDPGE